MKRRLVFLGPPASGKGTQATMVFDKYGIPPMSTGLILRQNVKILKDNNHEAQLKTGGLIPDTIVLQLVMRWLDDHKDTFLFDGFPRTVIQAVELDKELQKRRIPLESAIQFDLDDETIFLRALKRLTCENCGKTYSEQFENSNCCSCEGNLIRRDDDSEETLRHRLSEYYKKTAPLLDYYKSQNKLFRVDASADQKTVFSRISSIIESGRK